MLPLPIALVRIYRTPDQIRDTLPEHLHRCAFGTWKPAESHGIPAEDATHGPRVDESGDLGQLWEATPEGDNWIARQKVRFIGAIYPDGSESAWVTLDRDGDVIEHGVKIGGITDTYAALRLQEAAAWDRATAFDRFPPASR